MRGWYVVVAFISGCSTFLSEDPPGFDDSEPDEPEPIACSDALIAAWAPGFDITLTHTPPLELTEPGTYVYDVDRNELTSPLFETWSAGVDLEGASLLAARAFTLGENSRLRAVGSRPLVVAAETIARIDGVLDVSSDLGSVGAGGSPDTCPTDLAMIGEDRASGGGGGGGGGLIGEGGPGGSSEMAIGGTGGVAVPLSATLSGGCPGGAGGVEQGNAPRAIGGDGGGAVMVTAGCGVQITGIIDAGGGGGAAGFNDGGGGGGGSGGLIAVEAATVIIEASATLAANGGGGGGGGGNLPSIPGEDGSPGAIRAIGGDGDGIGGRGAAGDLLAGEPGGNSNDGAGGGGGGAGLIRVIAAELARDIDAVISPRERRM